MNDINSLKYVPFSEKAYLSVNETEDFGIKNQLKPIVEHRYCLYFYVATAAISAIALAFCSPVIPAIALVASIGFAVGTERHLDKIACQFVSSYGSL